MIYFLQPVDGGPVKIGFTDDIDSRCRNLESCYGRPLALLATMDGDRSVEREIHARFAHLRLGRTEQFRPGMDLMSFINKPLLVNPDPDAVEVMGPSSLLQTVAVKIDRITASRARMIAAARGISLAEFISNGLSPLVDKLYVQLLKDMDKSRE